MDWVYLLLLNDDNTRMRFSWKKKSLKEGKNTTISTSNSSHPITVESVEPPTVLMMQNDLE